MCDGFDRAAIMTLRGILDYYLPLYDFASPTWEQLAVLFASIGDVAPMVPGRVYPSGVPMDKYIEFNRGEGERHFFAYRDQAWFWYLADTGLLKPAAVMPWDLPSVGGLRVVDGAVVEEPLLEDLYDYSA